MDKNAEKRALEYVALTRYILKGKTIPEIAQILNYSTSTISNRLNLLFKYYSANNRFEFINNFFYSIINKYKTKLKITNEKNKQLKKKILSLESNIVINSKYSKCKYDLQNWINTCKEYVK